MNVLRDINAGILKAFDTIAEHLSPAVAFVILWDIVMLEIWAFTR